MFFIKLDNFFIKFNIIHSSNKETRSLKMNAIAAKKIENSVLIRRWSYELKTLGNKIRDCEYCLNFWGDSDELSELSGVRKNHEKLLYKRWRLEKKIAIKKAKIVYGDDWCKHTDEFY